MSFKTQVEGMTSLDIGTTPTTTEFEDFLAAGVKEVTERIIKFIPQQAANFASGTDVLDNNGTDLGGSLVLSVVRENGTIGEYVKAERVSSDDRFLVADSSSLSYKSKFHPAFWEFAGKVYIHPAPGSAGDEAYIQHVTYTAPANTDTAIANFPNQYEYLVTLYASLKTIHAYMSSLETPDTPVYSELPSVPEVPTIAGISFSFSESLSDATIDYTVATQALASTSDVVAFSGAPTYTPPTSLSLDTYALFEGTQGSLTITASAPTRTLGASPSISHTDIDLVTVAITSNNIPSYASPSTDIVTVIPDSPSLGSITFNESNALNITTNTPTALTGQLAQILYVGLSGDEDVGVVSDVVHSTVTIGGTPPIYNLDGTIIDFGTGAGQQFLALADKTVINLTIDSLAPIPLNLQTVSYVEASGDDATAYTIDTVNVDSVTSPAFSANQPSYSNLGTSPTSLAAYGTFTQSVADIGTISFTSVIPDVPGVPNFSTEDAALLNAVDTFAHTILMDVPLYNGGSIVDLPSALSGFSTVFSTAAPDLSAISVEATFPTAALTFNSQIANTVEEIDNVLSEVQALNIPIIDTVISPTLESWTHSETAVSAIASLQSGTFPSPLSVSSSLFDIDLTNDVDGDPNPLPTLWNPDDDDTSAGDSGEMIGVVWTDFNAAMDSEDFEEASAHLTKISQMVSLRESEFGREMDQYKEKLQRVLDLQTNDVDKQWAAELAVHNTHVSDYQNETNQIFTRWNHDFNALQSEYNAVNAQKLAKYQADSTVALNKFNSEKGEYDVETRTAIERVKNQLQMKVKDAELSSETDELNALNEYKVQFDQYEADIRVYGESVNKYSTEINAEMQEYNANLDRELQGWTNGQQNLLQHYENKVADTLNLYQAASSEYQAKVQMDLANLQSTADASVQKMQLSTNVDLQNKAQALQKEVQEYTAFISKYQAEVQEYQIDCTCVVQVYGQELAKYQAEIQKEIQLYDQERQYNTNRYQAELGNYQADIQDSLNVFNKDNVIYQAYLKTETEKMNTELQRAINKAQIEMQQKQSDARTQTDVSLQSKLRDQELSLQNAIQTMQGSIADNSSNLQNYQTEVNQYQIEVNRSLQEWQQNTSKDIQLWQGAQANILQQHQQNMQDALNVFNDQNIEYQAEVQKAVQQAQIDTQEKIQNLQKNLQIAIRNADKSQERQIQETIQDVQALTADNQVKISQFQAESAHYATQVNEDVQKYTSQLQADIQDMSGVVANNASILNKYQADITSYQTETATAMQVIQVNLQDSLNTFNEENIRYQADIQANITKFQADASAAQKDGDLILQAAIQDYTLNMQALQAEVAFYQSEVNTEVTAHTQNLQKALQTWTAEQSNELQRYQAEMQDKLNIFNDGNVDFQADIQKKLTEYQSDIQIAIRNADHDAQRFAQQATQDMQAKVSDYDATLQRYQAILQESMQIMTADIQTEQNKLSKFQSEVGIYSAEVQAYQADASIELQKYQADLQVKGVDYQWLQDQYTRIKGEYDGAFAVMTPQAQT